MSPLSCQRTLRELRILRHLQHENLMQVKNIFMVGSRQSFTAAGRHYPRGGVAFSGFRRLLSVVSGALCGLGADGDGSGIDSEVGSAKNGMSAGGRSSQMLTDDHCQHRNSVFSRLLERFRSRSEAFEDLLRSFYGILACRRGSFYTRSFAA